MLMDIQRSQKFTLSMLCLGELKRMIKTIFTKNITTSHVFKKKNENKTRVHYCSSKCAFVFNTSNILSETLTKFFKKLYQLSKTV